MVKDMAKVNSEYLVGGYRDFPKGSYSPSALNTYVNICQLQHRFRYIDRLRAAKKGVKMVFGSAMDEVFKQFYLMLRGAESVPTYDKLRELFQAQWKKELDDTVDFENSTKESWEKKAKGIIDLILTEAPKENVRSVDTAFVVPLKYSDGRLASERKGTGVLDMVAGSNGKIKIVDFKTSSRTPSMDSLATDIQCTMYSYGMRQVFPTAKEISFEWQYYLTTKEPQFKVLKAKRTAHDFDRMMKIVESVEAQVDLGLAVPSRQYNFACGNCGYKEQCDRWPNV